MVSKRPQSVTVRPLRWMVTMKKIILARLPIVLPLVVRWPDWRQSGLGRSQAKPRGLRWISPGFMGRKSEDPLMDRLLLISPP